MLLEGGLMRQIGLARRLCAVVALCAGAATLVGVSGAPAGAAGSNSLSVKAGEYTYKLSGSPKAGWTEINFDNAGVEYHVFSLVKLKAGTTTKQFKNAAASDDESAFEAIAEGDGTVGPQTGLLSPGQKTSVITKLAAGRYGAICFIPTPDGEPHFLHGMITTFDVGPGKSTLTPPQDGVVEVTIADDGITLPSAGLPKNGWAKVTNNTTVGRNLILARYLTPDADFETANAYFDALFAGQDVGEPPAALVGGVDGLAPGANAYFELTSKSGRYVLVSENQDLDDDDPNAFHVDFTVK
jgi:hypothetical protein